MIIKILLGYIILFIIVYIVGIIKAAREKDVNKKGGSFVAVLES